jgi:hypothetical protein
MIRKDKEIMDRKLISRIIKNCQVCRLGLAKDNTPYIVPVSLSMGFNCCLMRAALVTGHSHFKV